MAVSVRYNYRLIENRWKIKTSRIPGLQPVLNRCPQDLLDNYGWDTAHLYVTYRYKGHALNWNEDEIAGIHNGLNRLYCLVTEQIRRFGQESTEVSHFTQTVQPALDWIRMETFFYRTNDYNRAAAGCILGCKKIKRTLLRSGTGLSESETEFLIFSLVRCLFPFAPNLACELKQRTVDRIGQEDWDVFESRAKKAEREAEEEAENCGGKAVFRQRNPEEKVWIPVQLDGKVKAHICAAGNLSEAEAIMEASRALCGRMKGKQIMKVIYIPGRIISLATKEK